MGDTILIETTADEVVSIVTQGPQGPSGSEAATLTTTGDMLYRAALANDRLPIGSEGQVLKVSSGIPAWGNESGAVTEVNGQTGAVVLDAADVGAAPATGIDPTAISGTAVVDNDARLSDSRTPSSHASSHASAGSDPLAPSDIGAQSLFTVSSHTISADNYAITALRALNITIRNFYQDGANVRLPDSGTQVGDIVVVRNDPTSTYDTFNVQRFQPGPNIWITINTLNKGEQYRYINSGGTAWNVVPVDTHTHAASDITSGTLAHERGGLEADVSAYSGLVKIDAGSTSAVTVTAAGEALLDDADASAQRTTLGLGNSATLNTGTTAGTVATGDHTHADLHTRSHAITSTSDHTAGNHKVFYSDGSGQIQELALGNSGEVLTSNGASSAPSFAAASGGVTAVGASTADVLSVSGSDLVADDGGTIDSADPFIKWDDTAGKLVYANPLSRPSGAMYVGLAPATVALGTDALCLQSTRINDICVPSGTAAIAIGRGARATGTSSIAIGASTVRADSLNTNSIAIGTNCSANSDSSTAVGKTAAANAVNASAFGAEAGPALRGGFSTRTFDTIYWGGQTTDATPTILNLDIAANTRFTIAANTALAVDILLVARRSDTQDKWLVARRFLGIRRDGSNNTSLIGTVQTLGTDQTDGSPTWSFTLTADDTNEALQLEVTGAASETVQWRATAFYRVV